MEEYTLKQNASKALLIILLIGAVLYAMTSRNALVGAVLIGFPIAVFFLTRPSTAAIGVFFISFSSLTLSFLPNSLSPNVLLQALLIGWVISTSSMRSRKRIPFDKTDWMAALYSLVILLTMVVRGFGLRIMGSMEYGGGSYVSLLFWLGFYFACRHITLGEKQIRRFLLGLCVSSAIPLLLLLLTYLRPTLSEVVSRFSTVGLNYIENAVQSGEMGRGRWGGGTILAIFIVCYALATPFMKRAGLKRVLLIALAFMFSLVSGFRSNFFELIVIVSLWMVLRSRNRVLTCIMVGVAGILAWGSAFLLVDYLPDNMQRTLSLLPGIKVFGTTALDAKGSLDWRFEVWRYAVKQVPQYLLIGRGFVTNVLAVAWLQRAFYDSPDFAYLMGNYHSGPLSMFLTFGLPGAVAFFGFWLGGFRKGLAALRRHRHLRDHSSYRLLQFSTMILGLQMLWFVLLNGHPLASMPLLTLWLVATSWFEKHIVTQDVGRQGATALPISAPGA